MSARTVHPFPARMAPEIALNAIPELDGQPLTVLDPMCGSGTVLSVAVQRGHNAIGVDIDPLAVMMSSLAVMPIDGPTVDRAGAWVRAQQQERRHSRPWGEDAETEAFVDYWFGPTQKDALLSLAHAISELTDPDAKLALQVALSRTIVTKGPQASLAADAAHSRPHRVITTSDYDVVEGFRKSVGQLVRLLDRRSMLGTGTVTLGDARTLANLSAGVADIAVTSPPYLNALDYLRGHKLALVWFGHKISELRIRRSISIGAERKPAGVSPAHALSIVDLIESEATNPGELRRPMIERFATDCLGFAAQLHRTLKPGGTAVLVVGNSTLRGNYIRNDRISQMAMESVGFHLVEKQERQIPPSRRYMAIEARGNDSSITKRMRSEVVLEMVR